MTNRLDALTSARFMAALAVVAWHYNAIPTGGREAVTFFFALSGYVLTIGFGNRMSSWTDAKRFWIGRAFRLLPLHWLMIGMMLILGATVSIRLPVNAALLHAWGTESWSLTYNNPAWSISAEAFFYAVFPALLLVSPRRLAIWTTVGWATILFVAWGLDRGYTSFNPQFYYFPPYRLIEFAAGIVLARLCPRLGLWAMPAGIALVILGWQVSVIGTRYSAALLPGILLIIAGLASTNRLTAALSWRPLIGLGDASFALYMIHFPIMIAAQKSGIQPLWPLIPLVVILSIAIHRYIELPAYLWGKNFAQQKIR